MSAAREIARRALLTLAQAEITRPGGAPQALRDAAADALVAAGIGANFSHDSIRHGCALPREILRLALVCSVVKRCACGAVISGAEWPHLPFRGWLEDGAGGSLELRICLACHSSVAVEVHGSRVWRAA